MRIPRVCALPVFATLLLPVVACDLDIPDPDDSATTDATTMPMPGSDDGADADSGLAGQGRCAPDVAALSCDQTDCAFEITEIDCATACANVAALCADNDCDAQCSGLNQDVALCTAACEGTKNMSCSNVTFGCYTMDGTCDGVGTCVDANL